MEDEEGGERWVQEDRLPVYDELSFEDYLNNHVLPNTPFLLSSQNTASWPCTSWRKITNAGVSLPDLSALRTFSNHVVPVANTLKRELSEFERDERPLGEVLDLWDKGQGDGLYVKDWHMFEELGKKGHGADTIYTVPPCLRGDFRFCYIGPKGTFTPLHRDVYASYSWSANVVGRKLWWFFPPDALDRVQDACGRLVFDVRELEGEGGGIKVVQNEGEIIFVPSGWHHQVLNLDFCISINHNFFASPTLPRIFDAMQIAQKRVEESISDILPMIKWRLGEDGPWRQEWTEEVQGLLERDAGWGWRGFWDTVERNVRCPPGGVFSPPWHMRDEPVMVVMRRYKRMPEWTILLDVRATVTRVEALVASRGEEGVNGNET